MKLLSHSLDNLAGQLADNDDVSHDPQPVICVQRTMNRWDSSNLEADFVDDIIPHPATFPGSENDGIDWRMRHDHFRSLLCIYVDYRKAMTRCR